MFVVPYNAVYLQERRRLKVWEKKMQQRVKLEPQEDDGFGNPAQGPVSQLHATSPAKDILPSAQKHELSCSVHAHFVTGSNREVVDLPEVETPRGVAELATRPFSPQAPSEPFTAVLYHVRNDPRTSKQPAFSVPAAATKVCTFPTLSSDHSSTADHVPMHGVVETGTKTVEFGGESVRPVAVVKLPVVPQAPKRSLVGRSYSAAHARGARRVAVPTKSTHADEGSHVAAVSPIDMSVRNLSALQTPFSQQWVQPTETHHQFPSVATSASKAAQPQVHNHRAAKQDVESLPLAARILHKRKCLSQGTTAKDTNGCLSPPVNSAQLPKPLATQPVAARRARAPPPKGTCAPTQGLQNHAPRQSVKDVVTLERGVQKRTCTEKCPKPAVSLQARHIEGPESQKNVGGGATTGDAKPILGVDQVSCKLKTALSESAIQQVRSRSLFPTLVAAKLKLMVL